MRRNTVVVLALLVLSASARTAHAQTTDGAQLGLGYSFFQVLDGDNFKMPGGWLISAAQPANRWLSAVAEVAGNYKKEDGETLKLHTYQAGVRAYAPNNGSVRPYGQFLAGAATGTCCGSSETRFAIEPGGGVELPIAPHASVRVGVGFPMIFNPGDVGHAFRFHTGIAIDLGKR
jgi:hypothetical protein